MDQTKAHFSPHLRGLAHQSAKKPMPKEGSHEGAMDAMKHGESKMEKHTSETHGTQPHPSTGVHAVHVHHMGGGKAMTHTHHDGGEVESQEHPTMGDAHAHAQQAMPAADNGQDNDQDTMADNDSSGSDMDDMAAGSLGQMA